MFMSSLFSKIKSDSVKVENGIFFVESKAVGIVLPSSLEGTKDDKKIIFGSKSIIQINEIDSEIQIVDALINSGSIVFGSTPEVVIKTKEILNTPLLSRTSSYLLSCVDNCDQFLEAIDRITNASVLIIGCGGIGSLTALTLAGSGIKDLTLIDDDQIEESNLNRQLLWTRNDIGKFKVEVLHKSILDRFPDVNCHIYKKKLNDEDIENFTKDKDLVIITADEPLGIGIKGIENLAPHNRPKVISSGYTHSSLIVDYNNQADTKKSDQNITWSRNPYFIGPSFGPSNVELAGTISSLSIHEIAFNKLHNTQFISQWDSKLFPRELS